MAREPARRWICATVALAGWVPLACSYGVPGVAPLGDAGAGGDSGRTLVPPDSGSSWPDASGPTPDSSPAPDSASPTDGEAGANDADDAGVASDSRADDAQADAPAGMPFACGAALTCTSPSYCCVTAMGAGYAYACKAQPSATTCSGGVPITCDRGADCASGICCAELTFMTQIVSASCAASCSASDETRFCDPLASECTLPTTCTLSKTLAGFYECQ